MARCGGSAANDGFSGAEAGLRTHASNAERRTVRSAELPFRGTWWAAPGRLLVGPHPATAPGSMVAPRVDSLIRSGARTLIDLTQSHEEDQRGSCRRSVADLLDEAAAAHDCVVRTFRAGWTDQACPSRAALLRVLEAIERADGPVYVHCWNGIGRASLAAGAYLMEREGVRPADCLREIAERRLADRRRSRSRARWRRRRARRPSS